MTRKGPLWLHHNCSNPPATTGWWQIGCDCGSAEQFAQEVGAGMYRDFCSMLMQLLKLYRSNVVLAFDLSTTSTDVLHKPSTCCRVLYKPSPLPAGMEATITVELVAETAGDFVGEVTVKTEVNVVQLSVSAKVVPAAADEHPQVDPASHVSVADSAAGSKEMAAMQTSTGTGAVALPKQQQPTLTLPGLDETKTLQELLSHPQQSQEESSSTHHRALV